MTGRTLVLAFVTNFWIPATGVLNMQSHPRLLLNFDTLVVLSSQLHVLAAVAPKGGTVFTY